MYQYSIIGAGISGISAARQLPDTIILEKSKGLGGRIAARRMAGVSLNHGPGEFVHPHLAKLITDPHAWIKEEARDLNITKSWELAKIILQQEVIKLESTDGEIITCEKVILTLPAPQARLILKKSSLESEFLAGVTYNGAIQLFILKDVSENISSLSFLFDLHQKITLPDNKEIIFLKMKPVYISEYMNFSREEIKEKVQALLDFTAQDLHVHKWKYSEVTQALNHEDQLRLADKNIFLAGDYFAAGGISSSLNSVNYLMNFFKEKN